MCVSYCSHTHAVQHNTSTHLEYYFWQSKHTFANGQCVMTNTSIECHSQGAKGGVFSWRVGYISDLWLSSPPQLVRGLSIPQRLSKQSHQIIGRSMHMRSRVTIEGGLKWTNRTGKRVPANALWDSHFWHLLHVFLRPFSLPCMTSDKTTENFMLQRLSPSCTPVFAQFRFSWKKKRAFRLVTAGKVIAILITYVQLRLFGFYNRDLWLENLGRLCTRGSGDVRVYPFCPGDESDL